MKSSLPILAFGLLLLIVSCATTGEEAPAMETESETSGLVGQWKGDLVAGSRKIPFALNVASSETGGLKATLDSPTEGVYGIPVETVSVDGSSVTFSLPAVGAAYEATIDASTATMDGTWKQRGAELPLVMIRQETPTGFVRPQEPVPPFPYSSVDVVFENKPAGIPLAGTLTIPDGEGPFPGIVLITGSGAQNRDEEIFGHKPFLVLADALTRGGIAVLRFDDRGVGGSGGRETLETATTEDFAGDVAAAFSFLQGRREVDPDTVGLLGHSEGGVIAPALAARNPDVAFVVLLAAPGVPGGELLAMQSRAILEASGVPRAQIDMIDQANRAVYRVILETPDDQEAAAAITAIMQNLGMTGEQINSQLATLLSPWYRTFLTYDPIPALESLEIPVLALFGTLDTQVPAEENLSAIEAALERAPTDIFTVRAIDSLNHLFQTAETGLLAEYGQIEETMSPVVLDLIVGWLTEITD